ncbi:CopG family ribbon-helix-helix protein, partial [Escherichia coli]|uniref:CopG family ribbon-helix-helix protein n=2 Tax=Enterobacterales TaxID=91347 RepID=UPI0020CDD742
MAQVNMSLRVDAELKDAFIATAKSMDRNGSQLIRDFMRQTVERQHNTWFRNQVTEGRQQLERGDMVESSAAAW